MHVIIKEWESFTALAMICSWLVHLVQQYQAALQTKKYEAGQRVAELLKNM